jgi:prepilin peptidase CpaA
VFTLHFNYLHITLALLTGLIAIIWDLKYHKIPNWLTLPALLLGVVINIALNPGEWYFPFAGLLAGFILLFIPFALGGIGGGDLKLLAALGAILGVRAVLWIFLIGGVAGGLFSAVAIIFKMGLREGSIRIFSIFSSIGNVKNQNKTADSPSKQYIPYGLAIVFGLVITLIFKP